MLNIQRPKSLGMKNCLLKFLAGIFCLCFSSFLFAQTNIQSGHNQTNEANNTVDSSYGFYMVHTTKKEVQVSDNTDKGNSLIVSSAQTHTSTSESLKQDHINIFPNPSKNTAYIKIEATREYKFTIEISSVAGKLLQQKKGTAKKGVNIISLDMHAFAKGIYMVTVLSEKGKRETIKVVKE